MPKKKSKKVVQPDSLADVLDNASVVSLTSDGADSLGACAEADEQPAVTVIEQLCQAIENMTEKRPESRVKSLKAIVNYLRLAYLGLDSDSWNYTETFLNGVEFVLKKGRLTDRSLAAECLAVMACQFDHEEIPLWLERFRSSLDFIFRDESEPCTIRGKCVLALSWLCFFGDCDNYNFVLQFMGNLLSVFRGSCPKGDGKVPALNPDVVNLHLNALQAWTLMLIMLPIKSVEMLEAAAFPTLINLLRAGSVDIKIAAGETIAIIFERLRCEKDEDYRGRHYDELVDILESLRTDSDKGNSKDARKRQHQSFRDILNFLVDDECLETNVRIGTETMQLISCTNHFYYSMLCNLLSTGMNNHLRFNFRLRDSFGLGLPQLVDDVRVSGADRKASKAKRDYENQCAFKMRTQMLNQRREKRCNALSAMDDDA